MDLSDIALNPSALPKTNTLATGASLFVLLEGAHTMQSMLQQDRFSHPYGGEIIGSTYVGVISLLASALTKSPLPLVSGAAVILFFIGVCYWQEEKVSDDS